MYLYEQKRAIELMNERKNGIVNPKEYRISQVTEDREEQHYMALMTSMSHTYGNVLAFIQKWVMELFPEGLFKTVHVNSKIAHRQIRSTTNEMLKKSKPMIIFRPRFPGVNEEVFLKGTMLTERQTNIFTSYDTGAYQPFFNDPKNNFSIKYQMNRIAMYVDVLCIFSTMIQQLDYYHYIANAVQLGHPFFLNTCLENFIPQDMLQIVAQLSGQEILDEHGSIKPFLDYLNANSNGPITYKLQGASGTKEFYRYYPTNIDVLMNDLERDDGDRTGQVTDNYQITFTLRLEFNTAGMYFLFSDHLYDLPLPEIDNSSTDIIPVYTDVVLREDLNLAFGWHLYNRASYRLETSNDTVNFDELLNDSIREIINYHYENGIPIDEYLDLKIRKQGRMIVDGVEYTKDWKTKEIKFIDQSIYHTYTIMICANIGKINEFIKDKFKLDKIPS